METGKLLFGSLAYAYVNFEKEIEEIFGATPGGDVFFGGSTWKTISKKISIEEPFNAPLANGNQVTGDIMFEWAPTQRQGGLGMEITLIPAKLGTMPQTLLQDYYGIWVSVAEEGPNVGKLEIGIQNNEDDFAAHEAVKNNNGTYGFSPEEMKKKILELTGIDLDALN